MHEQFFNFMGLREDPFHVSPDPRFYYPTPAHESALVELLSGIETRQGVLVLTGEAGTGKTSLLNYLLDRLHRRKRSTAYIFHAHLEPIGLLRFILRDFGVPCDSKSRSDLVSALHAWLLERYAALDLPVLILDEAHALPVQSLDELRLLLNLETPCGKLLQIILSGQPELDEKLRLPALRQLRQRIMFHSRLPLLTREETSAYISSRLACAGCSDPSLFPDEVVRDIFAASGGIPRVVNLLCEHALISAYAEQKREISPEIIHRIAMDFDLHTNPLAVNTSELRPLYLRRLAPFPFSEKLEPAPVASAVAVETAFAAESAFAVESEFAVESAFVVESAIAAESAFAVEEEPVWDLPFLPILEFPEPVASPVGHASTQAKTGKTPRHWRLRRRPSNLAAFARNSAASVSRAWHAFTLPFVSYIRSVSRSFVRDCRRMFRALTLPTPALKLDPSIVGATAQSTSQRNILAPIVQWLRQPLSTGQISGNRSSHVSPDRKQ
jgi:general secretion pathway protein A